ncbi:MAG: SPOR domain-containing protein [Treponema sp.]|jgi:hypothetical protein|nr:SPOR domain-containing protein [Treponema sp.]
MKKLCLAVMTVIVAMLCVGASIWEGAAAVSISGELPEGGYYAATKSFPRNTVVDITNLETGKTVRVIVATGLDSPGLLAILSKDAAEFIGIQTRSIGRIRMTMPSDPVAFSRFTEEFNPSGDPDYDPRAAIAAASSRRGSQTPQRPIIPSGTAAGAGSMPPVWEAPDLPPSATEWTPDPPADIVPPAEESFIPADAPPEDIPWPWEFPAYSSRTDPPGETDPESAPVPASDTPLAWQLEETPPASSPEPAYRPPAADQQDSAIAYERGPELIGKPVPEDTTRSSIVLEPAEARPPRPYTAMPSNSEIVSITTAPPEAGPSGAAQNADDVQIPEQYIIPGIAETASRPPEVQPEKPAQPPIAEPVRDDPVGSGIEEPVSTIATVQFSAPLISTLEKGMYYLQLRAFSKTDLVQAELSRLGNAYPLAVQAGGTQEKPLYRVLVGPVNLGESSALLRRFKGNGYGDAFVRQAE